MAMTLADRKAFDDQFEGMAKLLSANFVNVHDKFDYTEATLKRMEGKIDKTNGRVNLLEVKEHERDLFCTTIQAQKAGYKDRKTLDANERKNNRIKWVQTITLVFMFFGLVLTLANSIKNTDKIDTLVKIETAK